jgi:hypothetical protein
VTLAAQREAIVTFIPCGHDTGRDDDHHRKARAHALERLGFKVTIEPPRPGQDEVTTPDARAS